MSKLAKQTTPQEVVLAKKTKKKEVPLELKFGPDIEEKINYIWTPYWLKYDVGQKGISLLERLLNQPKNIRPSCCLIVSETNNGKTTLVRKFMENYDPNYDEENEISNMPVVYVQAPPMADAAGLYNGILRSIGAPFSASWRTPKKEDMVLRLLTNLNTRMLIIDELHNVLSGKVDQRSIFLNALKNLSNELQIPVVGIGTKEVLRVFQTDQQFGNRFEPFLLPKWQLDKKYVGFIVKMFKRAKVQNTRPVQSEAFARRIHSMTEGLTGETVKIVSKILEHMTVAKKTTINLGMLKEIDWVMPSERRRIK